MLFTIARSDIGKFFEMFEAVSSSTKIESVSIQREYIELESIKNSSPGRTGYLFQYFFFIIRFQWAKIRIYVLEYNVIP